METFKTHPTYTKYRVGDQGTIIGPRGKPLSIDYSGGKSRKYGRIELTHEGCRVRKRVAHMVLETFVGPPPEGTMACHRNDIQGDDRLDNLYWGCYWDNRTDQYRNGKVNQWT